MRSTSRTNAQTYIIWCTYIDVSWCWLCLNYIAQEMALHAVYFAYSVIGTCRHLSQEVFWNVIFSYTLAHMFRLGFGVCFLDSWRGMLRFQGILGRYISRYFSVIGVLARERTFFMYIFWRTIYTVVCYIQTTSVCIYKKD